MFQVFFFAFSPHSYVVQGLEVQKGKTAVERMSRYVRGLVKRLHLLFPVNVIKDYEVAYYPTFGRVQRHRKTTLILAVMSRVAEDWTKSNRNKQNLIEVALILEVKEKLQNYSSTLNNVYRKLQ